MQKRAIFSLLFIISFVARASNKAIPGVFYVSDYSANGTHTDYDMARQAADAYAQTQYSAGSVLVLKPGVNGTCDAVGLPSNGTSATTSIIGSGSAVSTLQKSTGCPATPATLRHADSPNGALSRGWYQGFTVDASHIDAAGCELYGMSLTTFIDVACGNAKAGADHELEFGNRDANLVGWMDNIYIYGLNTFDSAPTGKGGILLPVWQNNQLVGVTVSNAGTAPYSSNVRAQLVGPGLTNCTTVPALTPLLNAQLSSRRRKSYQRRRMQEQHRALHLSPRSNPGQLRHEIYQYGRFSRLESHSGQSYDLWRRVAHRLQQQFYSQRTARAKPVDADHR